MVLLTLFSISFASGFTEAHGRTLVDGGTAANDNGMEITIGVSDLHLGNVTRATGATPLNARLLDSGFNVINQVAFTGNNATFDDVLIAGEVYYVVGSEDGGDYNIFSEVASPYPIAGSHLTWTGAVEQNTTRVTNRVYTITRLDVNPVNSTAVTFNSTTTETKRESYIANLTNTTQTPTAAVLMYNGTSITATITQIAGDNYTLSVSRDMPIGSGSKQFYFRWFEGATPKTTVNRTQTVQQSVFGQCNSTLTTQFVNYTFQDEGNQSQLTASIPTSSFTWWIGNGDVTGSLSYTNNTNFSSFLFCASPNETTNVIQDIRYTVPGYNQRRFRKQEALSNISTDHILYALADADGNSIIIQVEDASGSSISGVFVNVSRSIGGTTALIESGNTADDGTINFFLNPDVTYTFTFVKAGFTTQTLLLEPTGDKTVTLGTGINTTTVDAWRNVNYQIRPANASLNNDTSYVFNFTLSSTFWTIDSFGFRLKNSTSTFTTSSASTNGGQVTQTLNTGKNGTIIMEYWFFANGTYNNLTKVWVIWDVSSGTQWSIMNFFSDLKTYLNVGFFGLDNFGMALLTFTLIFLVGGILSFKFGLTSPAAVSGIIFFLVLFLNVGVDVIPVGYSPIKVFPTIIAALIFLGLFFREVAT